MSENSMDLLGVAKEIVDTVRTWADVDLDEQEYLDRLASFGEGFHSFLAHPEESGEVS
jgi:hypothetical protein